MADTTTYDLSRIVDASGNNWDIKAKGLESQVTIATTGDVTGSTTTDLTSAVSIAQTIGDSKVTTSKIADGNVTTAKLADASVTLAKIADSAKSGSVSDNDGKLATHAQVKAAIDTAISGQGAYKGKQTCAVINTWTADNLNNGDRVIASDAGTITLGSVSVRAGEDLIFFKNSETAIWQSMDGEFKLKQDEKGDPTASGTTTSFIATISQDTNGEITATKKTVPDASTSAKGIMKVGTGLSVSSGTVSVSYGTAAGTACQGNDSRLSDARTPTSHTHGNITNAGALQTTDVTIASGDKLVITDASNSNLVARASISFDASTTTTALTPKGTFEAFAKAADITTAVNALNAAVTSTDGTNVQVKVTEAAGKVTAVNITTDNTQSKDNIVTAFQSTPDDTHYPSEKLLSTELAKKQANLTFDGTYNASTNKAATVSSITSRIQALNVTDSAVTNQFVTAVSETSGEITVSRAQPTIANVSGLQTALDAKEPVFTINYNATDHSLVFSKTFGTVS